MKNCGAQFRVKPGGQSLVVRTRVDGKFVTADCFGQVDLNGTSKLFENGSVHCTSTQLTFTQQHEPPWSAVACHRFVTA